MTVLQTERLLLRPPEASDAKAMAASLSDIEVAGNLARVKYPYSLADARAWLTGLDPHPPVIETGFMIELGNGLVAGHIGFHDRGTGLGELGYYLGVPYWGKGYMFEAGVAALGWYFSRSGAKSVASGAFAGNTRSLALQGRLGFVEIGRSVRACAARGQSLEHIDTQLERANFEIRTGEQSGS
jgi:RimJ/RimL family protein N-acetyltransferase